MKVEWTTSELKETLLIVSALLWAIILLFPGDTFSIPSRVDLMSHYAPDHVWGILILIVCGPFFFINRYKHLRYRSFVHAFLWILWIGIMALAIYRSSVNGIQPTDLLIAIPFATLGLMHAIIYVGLGRSLHEQSKRP